MLEFLFGPTVGLIFVLGLIIKNLETYGQLVTTDSAHGHVRLPTLTNQI